VHLGIGRAVVTGGAGFIGSHLVHALVERGVSVAVVDDFATGSSLNLAHLGNAVEIATCDVNETERLTALFSNADCVFHLAALTSTIQSFEDPARFFHANVDGTFSVLEAARQARVRRVVYAASSSCYGIPEKCPIDELAPIRLEYPYGLTKYFGEHIVLHWSQVYGIPAVALRLFNVFGPRMNPQGGYGSVLAVFLEQKRAGKPLTIVGDGKQSRDFTYVTDVTRAFIAAAESNVSGEFFNIGTGTPQTINRLAQLVGGEVSHVPPRAREPLEHYADPARAAERLNWRAEVLFEEGVARVLGHDFSAAQ
jgi:UDP-glucose 4-epimerase